MPTDVFSLSIRSCIVKCKFIPLCAKLYNNVFVDMLTSATKADFEMWHCYHYTISPKTGQYVLSWNIKLFYWHSGGNREVKNKQILACSVRTVNSEMRLEWKIFDASFEMFTFLSLMFFVKVQKEKRYRLETPPKRMFHNSQLCCSTFCATFRSPFHICFLSWW